jgi:hypothetical protein
MAPQELPPLPQRPLEQRDAVEVEQVKQEHADRNRGGFDGCGISSRTRGKLLKSPEPVPVGAVHGDELGVGNEGKGGAFLGFMRRIFWGPAGRVRARLEDRVGDVWKHHCLVVTAPAKDLDLQMVAD